MTSFSNFPPNEEDHWFHKCRGTQQMISGNEDVHSMLANIVFLSNSILVRSAFGRLATKRAIHWRLTYSAINGKLLMTNYD